MKPTVPQKIAPVLNLESVAPDDPSLPRPRGKLPPARKTNIHEAARLKRTRDFGGLVPESEGEQFWMCNACNNVHTTKGDAFACHGRGAARVQVCLRCKKRIADCTCGKGGWQTPKPKEPAAKPIASSDSFPLTVKGIKAAVKQGLERLEEAEGRDAQK
jgi:hypothetical protein